MCWDTATTSESCDKALSLSPTSEYFPELKLEPVSPIMNSINPRSVSISNDGDTFSDEQNLYSTPLSWARPTMNAQSFSLPQPRQQQLMFTTLSPTEEAKLRNIAMPQRVTLQSYPESPSSVSSPEHSEQQHQNLRKRKSSAEEDDYDEEDSEMTMEHEQQSRESSRPLLARKHQQPLKKTAHNMIEKRYRTNLNDKIAALRDSVPSLRVMVKKNSKGEDEDLDDGEEDLQGLTPAHKLNKVSYFLNASCRGASPRLFEHRTNNSRKGHCPSQSHRIHRAPREAQQAHRPRERTAQSTCRSIRDLDALLNLGP